MRALVILPTYNELANLVPMVEAILDQGPDFNILVVDDGSPDGTGLLADHLKTVYPGRMEVIHRQGKLGLATAYLTGFRYAITQGYDLVFEMDADFSHNPAYLPRFLETMARTGADVVLGSRYIPGGGVENWPWYRKFISRGGSTFARTILGLPFQDLTGGFKCFRVKVLETLDLDRITANGYGFQIELTFRAWLQGFKVVEMPIVFGNRRHGVSKMSAGIFFEALGLVLRLRAEQLLSGVPLPQGERAEP
ncbi:MAG: polyprenol monophosphomannose synthase [Firmicutes bacterium]|nr:polyprenol monophosphomannose synthase [Bacillota bacterium]